MQDQRTLEAQEKQRQAMAEQRVLMLHQKIQQDQVSDGRSALKVVLRATPSLPSITISTRNHIEQEFAIRDARLRADENRRAMGGSTEVSPETLDDA